MIDVLRKLGLVEAGYQALNILVVGDVMLDRYLRGSVDRISPEAPVPVFRAIRTTEAPGGAANVSMNVVGLGANVTQAGFWGEDPERRRLEELLRRAGVNTGGMVNSIRPTISKTRMVARQQQLLRMDVEDLTPPPEAEYEELLKRVLDVLPGADAVVLSDYAKGALNFRVCRAVIEAGRARRIPVLVDPKSPNFEKYAGATTISPNLAELSSATGVSAGNLSELIVAGEKLVHQICIDFLSVTMSEKGILVLYPDSSYHSPARAREVFDVSGAGDTVMAVLAVCLANGVDPESAADLANVAAGVVVGKAGTVPITRSELLAEIHLMASTSGPQKLLNRDELLIQVAEWRAAGQRVVFTNGCFDILHLGHITLLDQCRQFGDKVVVAINSDRSVRCLKGPDRPVVGERERARVLAALGSIDAVVIFDEETPLELIRSIRPQVLVKGGDYSVETVVGAEDVLSWGGAVQIVPTVSGHSTSNTIDRMKGL